LGLSLLHELFVKEHNAICDALAAQYPNWSSEHRFQKARMINAALMAKIHTIEWTPAILANPMLEKSMNANWFGLFSDRVLDAFGRLGLNEAFWGIPDSGVNHHAAPYSLTEEFVAVYRMHSLMPDSITLKSHKKPDKVQRCSLEVGHGAVGQEVELKLWESFCDEEVLYSFGTELPGALSLNNYPNFLRRFRKPDSGELLDLATIDILRDRERQIPRYNRFRTELRMKPIRSFNEFNSPQDQTIAGRLRDVYGTHPDGSDKVDDLDLRPQPARHHAPAMPEPPRRRDKHKVAPRQHIRQRRLPGRMAIADIDHRLMRRPRHRAQVGDQPRRHLDQFALIDVGRRPVHRRQHRIRHDRGSGNGKIGTTLGQHGGFFR
jgi:hypothetical protein